MAVKKISAYTALDPEDIQATDKILVERAGAFRSLEATAYVASEAAAGVFAEQAEAAAAAAAAAEAAAAAAALLAEDAADQAAETVEEIGISTLPGLQGVTYTTDAAGIIVESLYPDGSREGRFWDPLLASVVAGGTAAEVAQSVAGLNGQAITIDGSGNIVSLRYSDGDDAVSDIDRVDDFPFLDRGSMLVVDYGQSLSPANDGGNAMSTTPSTKAEMAVGGIRASSFGASPWASITDAAEHTDGVYGETGLYLLGERLFDASGHKPLLLTAGEGGKSMAELQPGASPDYTTRISDGVSNGASLNDARGKSFGVAALSFVQGHADQGVGTQPGIYRRGLRAIRDYVQALANGIGQRETIPMFINQYTDYKISAALYAGYPTIGRAQHLQSLSDRRYIVPCPTFMLPHLQVAASPGTYDPAHLSNVGYVLLKQYNAMAIKRTLFDRVRWHPLEPKMVRGRAMIERQGKWFIVTFQNPTGTALQFNTSRVANPGDYGFDAIVGATPLGLDHTNFGIEGNRVFFKCTDTVPAFARLRAGFVGGYDASAPPLTSPFPESVVNLSDTSTETITFDDGFGGGAVAYDLHNYCVHFDFPVIP